MRIELSPGELTNDLQQVFTARFIRESDLIAEIKNAPHDIVTRWAELMRELHDGLPEIKRVGFCAYCGSTNRRDQFCGDCDRVFLD